MAFKTSLSTKGLFEKKDEPKVSHPVLGIFKNNFTNKWPGFTGGFDLITDLISMTV